MNAIPWIDDLPKDEVVAIAREEHEELGALRVLHENDQNEIDRLRAEVEELKRDLSGVTEECANLLKIKARLEAENERLKAERDAARKAGEER